MSPKLLLMNQVIEVDFTLIMMIDRRGDLSLSFRRGYFVGFFSVLEAKVGYT